MGTDIALLEVIDIDGEQRVVVDITQEHGKKFVKTQSLKTYIEENTVVLVDGDYYTISDVIKRHMNKFIRTRG